jgi:hypothetical protein
MFRWLPELPSTDCNGPMLCREFSISAGGALVRTTLGVKGSQVQILSSRRSTSPLNWMYAQFGGLRCVRRTIFCDRFWCGCDQIWGECGVPCSLFDREATGSPQSSVLVSARVVRRRSGTVLEGACGVRRPVVW